MNFNMLYKTLIDRMVRLTFIRQKIHVALDQTQKPKKKKKKDEVQLHKYFVTIY